MPGSDHPESKFPELVTYLDGELASEEKKKVEQRLARDDEYRRELAELQKTWDMLDLLPAVEATESFTQSTVEMAALNASTLIRGEGSHYHFKRLLIILLSVMIPVAGFCYGYWRMNHQLETGNREITSDLRVLQRFPIYRSVTAELSPEKSIEFLELLSREEDVFVSFDIRVGDRILKDYFEFEITPEDLKNRNVDPVRLKEFTANKKSFDNLGSQKENLRKFHSLLSNHPERDRLETALGQYYAWFRNRVFLSAQDEVDQLKDANPTERMQKIQQLETEYVQKTFQNLRSEGRMPSVRDIGKIKAFGQRQLDRMREQLIEYLTSVDATENRELASILQQLQDAPTEHHFFSLMIRKRWMFTNANLSNPFNETDVRDFIGTLSSESREQLEGLPEQRQLFWVILWTIGVARTIDDTDLATFEDRFLNGQQRDSLKNLSYKAKRDLLMKAFSKSLEPFDESGDRLQLPDDLKELEGWKEKTPDTPSPEKASPEKASPEKASAE